MNVIQYDMLSETVWENSNENGEKDCESLDRRKEKVFRTNKRPLTPDSILVTAPNVEKLRLCFGYKFNVLNYQIQLQKRLWKVGFLDSEGECDRLGLRAYPQGRARSRKGDELGRRTKEGAELSKRKGLQRCDAVTQQNVFGGKLKYFRHHAQIVMQHSRKIQTTKDISCSI
jgi:hypothetical protein